MEGHKQMSLIKQLTCVKTYDARGPSNMNFDVDIACLIRHAVAKKFQTKKL